MNEQRRETLIHIIKNHPEKTQVIKSTLEKMVDDRIGRYVEQALSSADVPELMEMVKDFPVICSELFKVVEAPVVVKPAAPKKPHVPHKPKNSKEPAKPRPEDLLE